MPGLSDADSMRAFIDAQGVDVIQHVDDPTSGLWNRFGVTEQRTYAYVNDDGTFRLSGYGSLLEDVEALIAQ